MNPQGSKTKVNKSSKATGSQSPKRVSRKVLRRRRAVKRVLAFSLVCCVVLGLVYVCLKMLFVVRSVEVNGSTLFAPQDITAFLKIPEEESIFKVDPVQLEERLKKEFTYIETVNVNRRLPDRIQVTITDSVETYYTKEEEGYKIYSQNFKFLRQSAEPLSDKLCLEVDMQNPESMDLAKQMIGLFATYDLGLISWLKIDEAQNITAWYQDRFFINFGTIIDMDYKVRMCKKVMEEKISENEKGTLDATKGGEIIFRRE